MNENIEKIKSRFDQLNNRERTMVLAAAIGLAFFIPYQFVWAPIVNGVEDRRSKVERQEQDLIWMQSRLAEVKQLSRQNNSNTAATGKSLYGIIERTARQKFGNDIRIQQEGKKGIRVQIKEAGFDAVIFWLDDLQVKYKANIKDFKIDRSKIVGNVRASILVEN